MGFELARAAARRGHEVTLIAGPVALATPRGVKRIDVTSARDMLSAVEGAIALATTENRKSKIENAAACPVPGATAPGAIENRKSKIENAIFFVATAAVADWRPAQCAPAKLKKSAMDGTLRLVRNPDILASVKGCVKIGFAAETGEGIEEARRKCRAKGAALIVLNDVTAPGAGFGSKTNIATFVTPDLRAERLPLMSKFSLGTRIVRFCERLAAQDIASSAPNITGGAS